MKKYQQGFEANEIFDWLRHSPNRCSHVSYQLTENLFFSSRSMNCFYLEASPKPPCERKFSLARNKGEVLHSVLKKLFRELNSRHNNLSWIIASAHATCTFIWKRREKLELKFLFRRQHSTFFLYKSFVFIREYCSSPFICHFLHAVRLQFNALLH